MKRAKRITSSPARKAGPKRDPAVTLMMSMVMKAQMNPMKQTGAARKVRY